jgi:hypothetical protein
MPQRPQKQLGAIAIKRIAQIKSREFELLNNFKYGYRNREDVTNLAPGVLVAGSQNVLTNLSDRVAVRMGYTLDGAAGTNQSSGITSSFDWPRQTGDTRHLRSYVLDDGTVKIEYHYVDSSGVVTWRNILTGLTLPVINYTDFWDFTTEKKALLLMVNGTTNVYEWSGGVTILASATANTITTADTRGWSQMGFYAAGTRSVVINGTTYAYTGGEATTTLTGVTPDPSAEAAGSIVEQTVRTTTTASITSFPTNYNISLISNLKNQIYYGSLADNTIYISKLNDYKNVAFTSPVRLLGEGALFTLGGAPVSFNPQEDQMAIGAGKDYIYQSKFTLSSDLTSEKIEFTPLKTTPNQAPQSQALTGKMKNNVIFVSNEPNLDQLGRIENILGTQQTDNLSDSIKADFDAYDFTDGSIAYFKYYFYLSVPKSGVVLVYNLAKKYWEAPMTIPVARFSIIDGRLYGHSYLTNESYKLFDGWNDNGNPIDARAVFSFQNLGNRFSYKSFNEFFTEGYISSNTTLSLNITYEIDGCAQTTSFDFTGDDSRVCGITAPNSSLGKSSMGKVPLGGEILITGDTARPPKFRWFKVFPRVDHFEYQVAFTSLGVDQRWELLAFGANNQTSSNQPTTFKN